MAAKRSAGILLYRLRGGEPEVLLVHPGGPFWARRDEGAWSIPKGEIEAEEDPRAAAIRELGEELGVEIPIAPDSLLKLGEVRQKAGKEVVAWAGEADLDPAAVRSNTFRVEWPPRSGKQRDFPEIDRAQWFAPDAAREKLIAAQATFIDRLLERLDCTTTRR